MIYGYLGSIIYQKIHKLAPVEVQIIGKYIDRLVYFYKVNNSGKYESKISSFY